MKPMFPFYGSKFRAAPLYSPPGALVIEPFAGSACFSLFWEPARVILNDIDPVIIAIWRYLQAASPAEIMALPDMEVGQCVDDLNLPQEAKWLIGFWLNRGSCEPKKTFTAFSARSDRSQLVWGPKARERIASQVDKIRHWCITEGNYQDMADLDGTWFIDPPYIDKGRRYKHSSSSIDFNHLGDWCKQRKGNIIVCENHGADWLPFESLGIIKSNRGFSNEVVFRTSNHQRLERL